MTVLEGSKIDQHGISELKVLQKLDCKDCWEIKNVNHLTNTLVELDCSGSCGINQDGISELNKLKILKCHNNSKINNVNHLRNTLEYLDCSQTYYSSRGCIDQDGISKLKKIKYMNCNNNEKIYDLNHLSKSLEELNCCESSAIGILGIIELKKIKKMCARKNQEFLCTLEQTKGVSNYFNFNGKISLWDRLWIYILCVGIPCIFFVVFLFLIFFIVYWFLLRNLRLE